MKLDQLLPFDSSLKIQKPNSWDKDIVGLCPSFELRNACIFFIKDSKILKKFQAQYADAKFLDCGAILDAAFYESLKNTQSPMLAFLEQAVGFIATAKNIDLCMSFLSRPFYEAKYNHRDELVDGRTDSSARIDSTARIANNVFIGQGVVIGPRAVIYPGCSIMAGSEIGEGSVLFPNVTLYRDVKIGKYCRIHANCVIGADGFGYNFHQGVHLKVWHTGSVIIHDHVEIGAGSTVDGGTFAPTIIGEGTKIDNLVQVGHNGRLGKGVILCGQVGLAGSVTCDDYVVAGGKAGVGPGVHVGKAAQVAGSAMVAGDVDPGEQVAGHPARPVKEWLKGMAVLRKLALGNKDNKKE